MRYAIVATLLLFFVVGCTPKTEDATKGGAEPASPTATGADVPVTESLSVTVGDVEQKVRFDGTIEQADRPQGIVPEELKEPRDKITLCNVNVPTPYPPSLVITYRLKCERTFPDTPVVLRGRVISDKVADPLQTFNLILGKDASRTDFAVKVDLMKAFSTPPDTTLVTADVDVILMPVGTDETSVDPAIATASPDRLSKIMGTPIRVNFTGAPAVAAAATPPAPTPAPAPSAPAPAPPQ